MKHALLIARHEFIETVRRPAFYLSILIFFVSAALGAFIPRIIEKSLNKPIEISIVDLSGNYAEALSTALMREDIIDDMAQINAAVRDQLKSEYQDGATPGRQGVPPVYLKFSRDMTSEDIAYFERKGGLSGYIEAARSYVATDATLPMPERRQRIIRNATDAYQSLSGTVRERAEAILSKASANVEADKHYLLIIPADFSAEKAAQTPIALWSKKAVEPDVARSLLFNIEEFAAQQSAKDRGEWQAVERYVAQSAELRYHSLDKVENVGGSREVDVVSFLVKKLPIALLFVVVIVVFTQSYILLTNTMEEKSNRIVEVMLSSVSPGQFMVGKLLGPLFIFGFLVILMFLAGTVFMSAWSLFMETPDAAQVPLEARQALAQSGNNALKDVVQPLIAGLLPKLPAALLYTVLAYLTYAGLFLATGAYCTDLRQVQAMSTPLNLLLMSVQGIAIVAAFDPDGTLAHTLTWLPPTAPFVMVGRLGADLMWWEYAGTILMQCATIYLMLRLAGKLFRHAALKGEGLPTFKQLGKVLMGQAG